MIAHLYVLVLVPTTIPHIYQYQVHDTTLILIPVSRYTTPTPGLHHTENVHNVTYNSSTNILMLVRAYR